MSIAWQELKTYLSEHFELNHDSVHGMKHWLNVERFGRKLAALNGADEDVVRLFAFFHDACRQNEFDDEHHGKRGAELARKLRGVLYDVSDYQFEILIYACKNHTHVKTSQNLTVGTCWDADRLDLPRVGIEPDLEYLSTEHGRLWVQS